MLGRNSGVGTRLKNDYPNIILWHCLNQRSANSGSRPKFGSQRLRAWVAKVLNVQPTNRYSTLNLGELGHFEGRPQQQFQGCRTPYFQCWLN